MKWIYCILSLYILALSLAPCGDSEDCKENMQMIVAEDHSDHEHQSENCSPFCTCNCCSVQVVPAKTNVFSLVLNFQNHNGSQFIPSMLQEIPLSIWQPPQIG